MTNHAGAHSSRTRRRPRPAVAALVAATAAVASLGLAGNASASEQRGAAATGEQRAESPAAAAGFAPYVDTSLAPAYDLVESAERTGVKEYNLAFITSGGGCTPKWGGVQELARQPGGAADRRAARPGRRRADLLRRRERLRTGPGLRLGGRTGRRVRQGRRRSSS